MKVNKELYYEGIRDILSHIETQQRQAISITFYEFPDHIPSAMHSTIVDEVEALFAEPFHRNTLDWVFDHEGQAPGVYKITHWYHPDRDDVWRDIITQFLDAATSLIEANNPQVQQALLEKEREDEKNLEITKILEEMDIKLDVLGDRLGVEQCEPSEVDYCSSEVKPEKRSWWSHLWYKLSR